MKIVKLAAHAYSNCHIEHRDNGSVVFVSYSTPVIEIRPNGYVYASRWFNCSATTRRQVGWFLREYTGISYTYLKQPALDGYAVHAFNGDMIPV